MNLKNSLSIVCRIRPSMRCVHVWPRAAKTEKDKYKSIDRLNWPDHGTGCQSVSLAMVKVKETIQSWLGYKGYSLWKLWMMIILERIGFLWWDPNRINKLLVNPLEGTCEKSSLGNIWL